MYERGGLMVVLSGTDAVIRIILAVIIGTLAAIVYSLRVLILMERRIARMELHLENMANKMIREEYKIEKSLKRRKK